MRRPTDAGLGTIRLERTPPPWIDDGTALRDEASVPGLLTKPIIDLAAGATPDQDPATVRLGAAGDDGHAFVALPNPVARWISVARRRQRRRRAAGSVRGRGR